MLRKSFVFRTSIFRESSFLLGKPFQIGLILLYQTAVLFTSVILILLQQPKPVIQNSNFISNHNAGNCGTISSQLEIKVRYVLTKVCVRRFETMNNAKSLYSHPRNCFLYPRTDPLHIDRFQLTVLHDDVSIDNASHHIVPAGTVHSGGNRMVYRVEVRRLAV